MRKKIKLNICPNPDCQSAFKKLVVICDKSKTPNKTYYGCPHCLFEMDPTAMGALKKIEKLVGVKTISVDLPLEKDSILSCPKYFGYLYEHFNDSVIHIQCFDCTYMSECIGDRKIMKVDSNA